MWKELTFKEMEENNISFKEGAKSARKNMVHKKTIKGRWVKKEITKREWEKHYKYHSNYTPLESGDKGSMLVGFFVIDNILQGHLDATDEEVMFINTHRKAVNVTPRPIE